MPATFPTLREAEALAVSGVIPSIAGAIIEMMDCVGAVAQYDAVELADDGNHAGVKLPATEGNRVHGVALRAGSIGDSIPVLTRGLTYVTGGATITAPAQLMGADDGEVKAATQGLHAFADLLGDVTDGNTALAFVHGARDTFPRAASFAAAAGGANVCEVTVTFQDGDGNTLAGVYNFDIWLSDAATGAGLTGTSASGTVTVKSASGAVIGTYTAKKALRVQTLAAGTFILEITDTAKTAFYVCAQAAGMITQVSTQLATGDYGS